MSYDDQLKQYHALLLKWQKKINLISPSTINDSWNRHFKDSIQVEPLIPSDAKTLFDLGCGAGFPGLVLAMMKPELNIHLVESDQKKCSFMKAVSRETNTPVTIHNERIEKVNIEQTPDVISARALASLESLFNYCRPWIEQNPNITLIFPKGEKAQEELKILEQNWIFNKTEHQSKTDPRATIFVFTNISTK